MLLLTSDGDLAQQLTHPRYKVEKEYEVTLDRRWDPRLGQKLLDGVFLDGKRARLARVQPIGPTRVRVVLHQGLNRQIRRMFYEIGYEVKQLVRTPHRAPAPRRNAARELASPNEKRTGEIEAAVVAGITDPGYQYGTTVMVRSFPSPLW